MKIYNRSAITVRAKQPFVDWINALTPESPLSMDRFEVSNTYLTNPDFHNADKHIKKYFLQIFEEELEGMWTDENDWPQTIDFTTFCEWFHYEISDWVQDLSKKKLKSDL